MGAAMSPVGPLVLCSLPPVEIMWEYLFTVLHDPLCVWSAMQTVIGTMVKGAAGLFQRQAWHL